MWRKLWTPEAVFRLSLYSLVAYVGFVLGLAEGDHSHFAWWTILFAAIGGLWTETRRGAGFSVWFSNTLGLLALCVAGREFFNSSSPETKLLSGAHLVLYLTWIVLLQIKSDRHYWALCALSVLQMAVAAVLVTPTESAWFGLCSTLFAVAAIWTLAIFTLESAHAELERMQAAPAPTLSTDRWLKASVVQNEVQHDGQLEWLNWRFVGGVATLSLMALLMSAIIFVLTPRIWIRRGGTDDAETVTSPYRPPSALAREVRLGQTKEISHTDDLQPVLTVVQLADTRRGDRPLTITELAEIFGMDEPLFRSVVLIDYRDGVWKTRVPNEEDAEADKLARNRPRTVRETLQIEPSSSRVLLAVGDMVGCEVGQNRDFGFRNWASGLVYRDRGVESPTRLTYSAYVSPPTVTPAGRRVNPISPEQEFFYSRNDYLKRCRQFPTDLRRLRELSTSVVREAEQAQAVKLSPIEIATRLEGHLRRSGQYSYTLEQKLVDDRTDPVEDFLFNRQEGHCEYFAAALCLMVRAQGIPARLVTGYKGGEVTLSGRFQVQQRHAHAWVEVWSDADHGWVTFDATPPDERARTLDQSPGRRSTWERLTTLSSDYWNAYFATMSLDRQQDDIYSPLKELGIRLYERITSLPQLGAWLLNLGNSFLLNPQSWFNWQGALLLAVMLSVAFGISRFVRRCYRFILKMADWQWRRRQRLRLVEFYERFAALVRQRGITRAQTQTQQEFCRDVAVRLRAILMPHQFVAFPEQLGVAFYRVRFGEEALSPAELADLEQGLQRFEVCLQSKSAPGQPS